MSMKLVLAANALLCVGMVFNTVNGAENTTSMQFRGTLIEPPSCTINKDDIVDINFGENIAINKIDGINYRQVIGYRITCDSGNSNGSILLNLNGTATRFDEAAVQTNQQYLGIRIYQNAVPFKMNTVLPIDSANPPVLAAVPVGEPGQPLKEGAFVATATLLVSYQ
jgi:type 1 fimbria pilin